MFGNQEGRIRFLDGSNCPPLHFASPHSASHRDSAQRNVSFVNFYVAAPHFAGHRSAPRRSATQLNVSFVNFPVCTPHHYTAPRFTAQRHTTQRFICQFLRRCAPRSIATRRSAPQLNA